METANTLNVIDKYKGWLTELVREDVIANTFPYAVLMTQLEKDYNIGCVIRSGNALGANKVFYYGPSKRFDIRGTVGTRFYTQLQHLKTMEEVQQLKKDYSFVVFETLDSAINLPDFQWPKNPLMIFGEESIGLPKEFIELADYCVKIPMYGSVRSFNTACAATVAMYDWHQKNKE